MISPTDKETLRKRADREVVYLIGAFASFWVLLGWLAYSAFSIVQCNQRFGDVKGACAKALSLPLVPEELRSMLRRSLIEEHIAKNESGDALKLIAEEEAAGSATAELFSKKADLLRQENKPEESAIAFRKALELEPDNESYFSSLISLQLEAGKFADARTDAATFLVTNPKSATALSWAGWVEHRDGKYEQAVQLYERALTFRSDDGWLHYDLGVIHANVGEFPKALVSYNNAVALDPTNSSFFTKRAELHSAMGQHKMAQADYASLIAQSRSDENLIGLARSYTDSRDFEMAEPLLDEALLNDNKNEWAHDSRIRLLYRSEKYAEARAAVVELRSAVQDSNYAIYWTAILDDEEGKDEDALKGYVKSADFWPTDAGIQTDIGHVLIDLKRTAEALTYFQKAVALAPHSTNAYVSRARAFLFLSRWQEAIADANTALRLDPQNGVALSRRANAEWGLGQTALAKEDYDKALQLSPHAKWLRSERIDFLIDSRLYEDAQAGITMFAEIDQASAKDWQAKLDQARSKAQ